MNKGNITVDKKWLTRRAKTTETHLLRTVGKSLSWGSIEQRLYKCIVEVAADENWMVINYEEYKKIIEEIKSEYKGG